MDNFKLLAAKLGLEMRSQILRPKDPVDKIVGVQVVEQMSNIARIIATTIGAMTKELCYNEFNQQFLECDSPEKAVNYMQRYFQWMPILPAVNEKYSKDWNSARKFVLAGDNHLSNVDPLSALRYFNLAVVFAECDATEEYGNLIKSRSKALAAAGHPEEALLDLESLEAGVHYPAEDSPQLEKQRILLKEQSKSKLMMNSDPNVQAEKERGQAIKDKMLNIEEVNPLIPAAAEFVQIKCNQTVGRHLVVDRDVRVGTPLVVESPFAGKLTKFASCCHHCFKKIRRGIPCNGCVFAFYCNETCREAAAEAYHRYECAAGANLHGNPTMDHLILPFRMVCKAGPEQLLQLYHNRDPQFFRARRHPFGTRKNTQYDSNSYLSAFHLVTHFEKSNLTLRLMQTLEGLMLASILEKHTGFFDGIPAESRSGFRTFVATLLLRHISATRYNAANFYKLKHAKNDVSAEDETYLSESGSGIYPVISLLSHSCDPNTYRLSHTENGTLIVVAIRALKKGEIITTSYGPKFVYDERSKRQSLLRQKYLFECNCIACRRDWPAKMDLLPVIYCCSQCSRQFLFEERDTLRFLECCLNPQTERSKCRMCKKYYRMSMQRSRLFETQKKVSDDAEVLVEGKRASEALLMLQEALEYHQFSFALPTVEWFNDYMYFCLALDQIFHSDD